jgi:putative membrane protein
VKRSLAKLRIVCLFVNLFIHQVCREKKMLINIGRLLMICVWGFMIFNIVHPFPKPLKYFMDVAMVFMIFMHALQTIFLKASLPKDQKLTGLQQTKIFFFGVFEMLAMHKKTKAAIEAAKKK